MTWTCPRCDRSFGRKRAHVCETGMPVEVRLAELPDGQREAAEAVLAHLETLGEMIVEAVGVGILVKRDSTFIELRPKKTFLALSFILDRTIDDRRISRTVVWPGGRAHFVRLTAAKDVDAQVRRWLTASYRALTDRR